MIDVREKRDRFSAKAAARSIYVVRACIAEESRALERGYVHGC